VRATLWRPTTGADDRQDDGYGRRSRSRPVTAQDEATRRHDMVFAADYPLLNIFWTMIIFFSWVIWVSIVIRVIADVFRRRDSSGLAKAGWVVLVIVLPFLGVLIYMITNGTRMAEDQVAQAESARSEFDDYVKSVAAPGGPAAEIQRAKGLLDSGAITAAEFGTIKAKALA
jgi:hypothetical protein